MKIKEIKDALGSKEMGLVIATKKMLRVRPDGVEDFVTIEVGMPQEHLGSAGRSLWTCTLRISGAPQALTAPGQSSLEAIINATYLAAQVLKRLPFASEIDMSLLPNFGLPVSPVTTTPDELDKEQKRPKSIRVHPIPSGPRR